MANITQVRKGQAIRWNNDVCLISELNHRTPPNLRAFVQVTMRSLATGKVSTQRLTPNDNVDIVPLNREEYDFSYADGDGYHFLHAETFDDTLVPASLVEDVKNYLIENNRYTLLFTDGRIAAVELPPSIVMKVADAPEGVKGDSANNVYKAATMETGLVVQVPLFIKNGESIRVNTEDGKYLSRA